MVKKQLTAAAGEKIVGGRTEREREREREKFGEIGVRDSSS